MRNRKMVIAGNWKMNGFRESVVQLLRDIRDGCRSFTQIETIVFPPSIYIPDAEKILAGSNVAWGAQNVSDKANGAFTGEISTSMLLDFRCRYVIVGHSERRILYGESEEMAAAKFKTATMAGLTPIFCVGETATEREQNRTLHVITQQLQAVLALEKGIELLQKGIVAYEPVWAIGTGNTATPEQAQYVHKAIREIIAAVDPRVALELRILYGGSMNAHNARDLLAEPDIDGGLVGGASLKSNEFLTIVQLASEK